jgi:hypothetical protein
MARKGISEKIQYVHNPLPNVTEEDLLAKTDLDLIRASTRPFFEFRWKYGAGLENEFVVVSPGEFLPLRASEARDFLREFSEMGGVIVEDKDDADAVRKATDKGLQAAFKFWSDRGSKRVAEYRKRHGISKDDLEDHMYDLWVYFRNQAAADLVKATISELRKSAFKKSPAAPKE